MDVWVHELEGIRPRHYVVMVDGRQYDMFHIYNGRPLTFREQIDVARGYKEALENYEGPRR